jgi:hypothetical protein
MEEKPMMARKIRLLCLVIIAIMLVPTQISRAGVKKVDESAKERLKMLWFCL